jgi:ornithine cyclodeaminase
MRDGDILILKGHEVASLLAGQENELLGVVRLAYEAHAQGNSSLPHSSFLQFPANQRNRIIALPAYLGQEFDVAGIKWISSFPGNLEHQLSRASAVVILNSALTGRPQAIVEGSIISAKRTAASAVLAAKHLLGTDSRDSVTAGILGCGLINLEVVRFLLATCPQIGALNVFDLSPQRARQFKSRCEAMSDQLKVNVVANVEELLRKSTLISIATTTSKPHLYDLSACAPGTTILHVSLRDLSPEVILSCDNIVDDIDHVCRAQTSIHLAEQLVGNRDFIRCTLADILRGEVPARTSKTRIAVFSPFGLGVLDLAVTQYVRELAFRNNVGMVINSFLPDFTDDAETVAAHANA